MKRNSLPEARNELVMSLDVVGLLTDTDADTDTTTVNRVESFEFRFNLLELSSPHYDL